MTYFQDKLFFFCLQKLLCAATLALLCLFVARCALRSQQWQSERSLFTSALAVCPLNAKVSPSFSGGRVLTYASLVSCG